MDDIVKMVVEKTGLPEAQAQMAVNVVIEQIKGKLPENMQGMVDMALGGGGADAGGMGNLGGMLGGLLKK